MKANKKRYYRYGIDYCMVSDGYNDEINVVIETHNKNRVPYRKVYCFSGSRSEVAEWLFKYHNLLHGENYDYVDKTNWVKLIRGEFDVSFDVARKMRDAMLAARA